MPTIHDTTALTDRSRDVQLPPDGNRLTGRESALLLIALATLAASIASLLAL
jgi:hypothetical protein